MVKGGWLRNEEIKERRKKMGEKEMGQERGDGEERREKRENEEKENKESRKWYQK